MRTERRYRHLLDILVVQQDHTLVRIIKPEDHVHDRGLAATRWPDERRRLANLEIMRKILDDPALFILLIPE